MLLNADFSQRAAVTPDTSAAEILVIDGELREGGPSYVRGSWIRLPAGEYPDFVAGPQGVVAYLKTGGLAPAGRPATWPPIRE